MLPALVTRLHPPQVEQLFLVLMRLLPPVLSKPAQTSPGRETLLLPALEASQRPLLVCPYLVLKATCKAPERMLPLNQAQLPGPQTSHAAGNKNPATA